MKIGQAPGSSASGSGAGGSGAANHNSAQGGYQGSGMSGPVKAAHHSRPGMGGQTRTSGGLSSSAGGLDDLRSPSSNNQNHSFNAQGTSLHHGSQGASTSGDTDPSSQRSPNRAGKGAARHSGSPTAGVLASSASSQSSGAAANSGSRSRPRPARQNQTHAQAGAADSRSVSTPQRDTLSTSAESSGKASKTEYESTHRRVPTPLSEE